MKHYKTLPILVIFQLISVFPHYHEWLGTTWEVEVQKGLFKGTFFSKKLNWNMSGRSFTDEEYDSKTNTVHLGAFRL